MADTNGGSSSSNASFSYTRVFDEPGTVYYTSAGAVVSTDAQAAMSGVITVLPAPPTETAPSAALGKLSQCSCGWTSMTAFQT